MAQFTPSALSVQSLGSVKLTIAHVNENIISGTDYWASGIPDIRSMVVQPLTSAVIVSSSSGFSVNWTKTDGTIWLVKDRSTSGTGYIMWVLSGGPSTKE